MFVVAGQWFSLHPEAMDLQIRMLQWTYALNMFRQVRQREEQRAQVLPLSVQRNGLVTNAGTTAFCPVAPAQAGRRAK